MQNASSRLTKGKLKQRIYILFWLTFLLSFSFEISSIYLQFGILHYIILLVGRMLCIAAVVYANVFYFIPKLLRKQKYIAFALTMVASALVLYFGTAFFNLIINLAGGKITVLHYSKAYFLTLIFTGLRISFLAYLLFVATEWIDQKFSIQELQLEKSQVENRYLRNQLNPHFLFNTMNNIHGLILTDVNKASASVLQFSDFLQYMVYESAEDFIPLEKEMQLIEDYIALERLRADKKKQMERNIEVNNLNFKIAPLLLLPLVENGIKHGLNVMEEGAFLQINISQHESFLTVSVINSKPTNVRNNSAGIGLKNLKRRLELQYKDEYELRFTEEPTTFQAVLNLKLHAL